MIKGGQNPFLQATSHRDKGLGPILDPGGGGEGVVIVAERETIALVVRVVLQYIDEGAAEIDHQEEIVGVGMEEGRDLAAESEIEREEGLVETGGEESTAPLLNLIENEIEIEREEGLVETRGEESVALLPSLIENEIKIERGEESTALLSLIENVMLDTEKEEGGGALLRDHRTGTGGGAGEGGGADLAANVTKVCILLDIGLLIIMLL